MSEVVGFSALVGWAFVVGRGICILIFAASTLDSLDPLRETQRPLAALWAGGTPEPSDDL